MGIELTLRPQTLDKVIGNKQTISMLKNMFERPQAELKHTFMFSGPKGCGKTTLARICAKMAGCSTVNEYDIANLRGIDTAREIVDKLPFKAILGGSKAYILDEVHKGTNDFFNAMLKPLEEPPNHVFFFLCTTDPQKVLPTVKSRCAQYEVSTLSLKQTILLLKRASKKSKQTINEKALKLIAKNSEGTPREALIMLDQIIGMNEADQLKLAKKAKTQEAQVIELCRALLKSESWGNVSDILKVLKEDPESVRRAVLGYMNSVMLSKGSQQAANVIDCFAEPFYNIGAPGLTLACWESLH